jgi:hypothetical protein
LDEVAGVCGGRGGAYLSIWVFDGRFAVCLEHPNSQIVEAAVKHGGRRENGLSGVQNIIENVFLKVLSVYQSGWWRGHAIFESGSEIRIFV